MATISEIRPAGGGDFSSLQSWEDWADGQASGDQWAECYTGGDLGEVTVSGWTGTINSTTYPRIYAADSNRHNGDITAGAYITGDGGTYFLVNNVDYVEIDGLRCSGAASDFRTIYSDNITCKNLLVENTSTTSGQRGIYSFGLNLTIYNCIVIGGNTACQIYSTSSTGEVTAKLYNNTVYGFGYAGIFPYQDTEAITVTIKNNIVFGSSSCFRGFGSPTVTSDYNCIGDGTLTSLGWNGSNDLESQTLSNVLTDAANDDFTLVENSVAINQGEDLTDEGVTTDIAGTARFQGSTHDIGAFETVPNINTIKPDGSGDYTTLQSWEDWADGQSSSYQWAECYTGGSMGALTIEDWSIAPTAFVYPKIYAAEGESHEGSFSSGAYANAGITVTNVDYVTIEKIRLNASSTRTIAVFSQNITIDSCLCDGASTQHVLFLSTSSGIVKNCIIKDANGGSPWSGIAMGFNLSEATTYNVYNNVIYNCYYGFRIGGSGGVTANLKNNIIMGNTTQDFIDNTTGGTVTLTSDYNILSDGSLTSEGYAGSNDIESQTLSNVLTNAASGDFTIVEDGPAHNAGEDLSSIVKTDVLGVPRPQEGTMDIGAYEIPAYIWESSGNWSNTSSWSGRTIPTSTSDVTFSSGGDCTVDGSYSCQSLTVSDSYTGALDCANDLTINNGSVVVDGHRFVVVGGGGLTIDGVEITATGIKGGGTITVTSS